jgi:hypothetical protein
MQCPSNREFEPWEKGFEYMVGSGRHSRRTALLGRVLEGRSVGSSARVIRVEIGQGEEVLGIGTNHALRHTRVELEDLPADVP